GGGGGGGPHRLRPAPDLGHRRPVRPVEPPVRPGGHGRHSGRRAGKSLTASGSRGRSGRWTCWTHGQPIGGSGRGGDVKGSFGVWRLGAVGVPAAPRRGAAD